MVVKREAGILRIGFQKFNRHLADGHKLLASDEAGEILLARRVARHGFAYFDFIEPRLAANRCESLA